MKGKVLVTGADLAPQAAALLEDYELVFAGKTPSEQDIIGLCQPHDPVAIIVRYGKITADAIKAAPGLKVISKHGSGTDTIDKAAAAEHGVAVVAAIGANAPAVAEHAVTLLLACAKSVPHLNARMHDGHWDKATHKNIELAGRTLGLVGLGAIGRRMARIAHAMDMRVIGFDPYAQAPVEHVQLVDMDTIWRESDAISLHCPLTEDNRHLINADTLARCKPGVIIVNTARGGLINEPDLVAAVAGGQVHAAGLDSFGVEPIQADNPFLQQAGIILSPHVGGVTHDAYVHMGVGAARNLLEVLAQTA